MKIHCIYCGKAVSTELPDNTIFRATAECPECVMNHLQLAGRLEAVEEKKPLAAEYKEELQEV